MEYEGVLCDYFENVVLLTSMSVREQIKILSIKKETFTFFLNEIFLKIAIGIGIQRKKNGIKFNQNRWNIYLEQICFGFTLILTVDLLGEKQLYI